MNGSGGFGHDRWSRRRWRDRRRERRNSGGERGGVVETLSDLALQAGLWAAGCLAIASTVPTVLMAPVLRELLLIAAISVSAFGLLRGEPLTLAQFNRHDVALLLVALAMVSGLFVDHMAIEAYFEVLATAPGLNRLSG